MYKYGLKIRYIYILYIDGNIVFLVSVTIVEKSFFFFYVFLCEFGYINIFLKMIVKYKIIIFF